LDTPGHGAVISGTQYFNQGWVLTPQPNHIPTDGSTINVYIDGVYVGHPTYNKRKVPGKLFLLRIKRMTVMVVISVTCCMKKHKGSCLAVLF